VKAESRPSVERYRIGDLALDSGSREVSRGRQQILLPNLSFELLLELARSAPNVVAMDDLMTRVWHGVVVSPDTVAKRVELLRHALGDDSHVPRYVGLVRGHGYRLLPTVQREREGGFRFGLAASIAAAALIAVALIWLAVETQPRTLVNSVAVLPFVSMSETPQDEYFADGLTEELVHSLASIPGLKIIGRTSSFYYKGRNEDLRAIGKTLGVAYVLEGSVRRAGDRLRVTVQLVKTADGYHLWSETYDRTVDDILEIQGDIARGVARALRRGLLSDAQPFVAAHRTSDPLTYALYLKALKLVNEDDSEALTQAQAVLEQVLEQDPQFLAAWNRLASVHIHRLMAYDQTYPYTWDQGWQRVQDAVGKALVLDPDSAYAHGVLGAIEWLYERDVSQAAAHFQNALDSNPMDLEMIGIAGNFAKFIGRLEEAVALEEYVLTRDPLCTGCRYALARTYRYLGRLEEAENALRTYQLLAGGGAEYTLGITLLLKGDPAAALNSFEALNHHEFLRSQGRALALHDLGRRAECLAAIDELRERWGEDEPWEIAKAYAYIKQPDTAFAWLEQVYERNPLRLQTEFQEPLLASIHGDPRWHALLERVGRTPEQLAEIDFEIDLPQLAQTAQR